MGFFKNTLILLSVSMVIGCSPLTQQQKAEYDLMKNEHVLVEEKNPTTGAVLGILPGFGAFYAREPLVGVVDLLLWPLSVLWDPVIGFEMSKKVNFDLTLSQLERKKSRELTELENERDLEKISNVEYVTRKRVIEQKYDYRTDGI